MPKRAFLLQEKVSASARVGASIDGGKKAGSTIEYDTDNVSRRAMEEVASS